MNQYQIKQHATWVTMLQAAPSLNLSAGPPAASAVGQELEISFAKNVLYLT
jgi:hypothetical protein